MTFDYQQFVESASQKELKNISSIQLRSPGHSHVWNIESGIDNYIIKIGLAFPERLNRETDAYLFLSQHELSIPKLISHGFHDDIPYLILEDVGNTSAKMIFSRINDPVNSRILRNILENLYSISQLEHQTFDVVSSEHTVANRDQTQIERTQSLEFLNENHLSLLERIDILLKQPYPNLAHRDFSPRQVVMSHNRPAIIDFESLGSGYLEKDIADFFSDIFVASAYRPAYGSVLISFCQEHYIDINRVQDFIAYSLLSRIKPSTSRYEKGKLVNQVNELIMPHNWFQ